MNNIICCITGLAGLAGHKTDSHDLEYSTIKI